MDTINNLRIRNFQVFKDLTIPQVRRVNLVVGKNGVGKSCLLEALQIFINNGSPQTIWQILERRDEGDRTQNIDFILEALRHLFWGRNPLNQTNPSSFEISELDNPKRFVKMTLALSLSEVTRGLKGFPENIQTEYEKSKIPGILIENGSEFVAPIPLNLFSQNLPSQQQPALPSAFIPANGLDNDELARMWDRIALTEAEEEVARSLQSIHPKISRVSMVAPPNYENKLARVPVTRLADAPEPVPLRSLGEGMVRWLAVSMSLASARNGVFLIDELESGLHYSVLQSIWSMIFETAKRLNVQVFATTHSWDCILAFQQAAYAYPEDGLLIRLEKNNGDIRPVFFDETDLPVIVREQIEVR